MSEAVTVFGPPVGSVRVLIEGELAIPDSDAVEREWAARRARNPKLHDGPVLHVQRLEVSRGEIVCLRTTYKAFMVGHLAGLKIESLGITGMCVRADDPSGAVLLGRRSENVRIYAGLWETAPRGAVEAPTEATALDSSDLSACLATEGREELGVSIRVGACVGIVRDAIASSLDLCFRCELDGDAARGNWEYQDRVWLTPREIADWARGNPPPRFAGQLLSPPCAAWFRSRSL